MPAEQLTQTTAPQFEAMMDALEPNTRPRWGSLDAHGLLAHLRRTFEISMEEIEVEDLSNFLTRSPLFWRLVFEWMPWPKGKIKAPDYFTPASQVDFETERQAAKQALRRFLEAADSDPRRTGFSPLLGPVPLSYWRVIHAAHMRHHFKQFGATPLERLV
jgi:hypothetical protein